MFATAQQDRQTTPQPLPSGMTHSFLELLPALFAEAVRSRWRWLVSSRLYGVCSEPIADHSHPTHSREHACQPNALHDSLQPRGLAGALPHKSKSHPGLFAGLSPGEASLCALEDFGRTFYVESHGVAAFRRHGSARRTTSFWQTAELIEIIEDALDALPDTDGRRQQALAALFRGVSLRYGRQWTRVNEFNDDVMWMVLATLRAHRVLGSPRYLEAAQQNFHSVVARAWSADFGGGLWWTTARREKNACVNGPAVIAGCYLYATTGDPIYLNVAQHTYGWLRERLFDAETGRVSDRIESTERSSHGSVVRGATTYNQGTFIGAGDLLHAITGEDRYSDDARLALEFTRRELVTNGLLRSEGESGDGGGFKGIFARYAVPFVRRCALDNEEHWLWANAQAAWDRRDALGLIPQDWTQPSHDHQRRTAPSEPHLTAWDASSGIALLLALARREHMSEP